MDFNLTLIGQTFAFIIFVWFCMKFIWPVLMNAIEAQPQGGTIAVKTWADDAHVLCTVRDGGPGITPDAQRRALEPFFTTKAGEHKGLGLNVAHGLLRRHAGDLEIAPASGHGTVVTLRLPVLRSAD